MEIYLNIFLPPLPKVGCQIFLEIWKPWGKVMERRGLIFDLFCLKNCLKSPRKKKCFFFADFALHPAGYNRPIPRVITALSHSKSKCKSTTNCWSVLMSGGKSVSRHSRWWFICATRWSNCMPYLAITISTNLSLGWFYHDRRWFLMNNNKVLLKQICCPT